MELVYQRTNKAFNFLFPVLFKIIEELEDRVAKIRNQNSENDADSAVARSRQEKELKKLQLKYEILARNELNKKLNQLKISCKIN